VLDNQGHRLDLVVADASHRVFVSRMDRSQLLATIAQPAERVGLVLEEGLAVHMLADAGDEPGLLPLLDETLDLMWRRRSGRYLTSQSYEFLGGITGELQRRVDALLDSLSPLERSTAQRILVRLVNLGEDDIHSTRRRVSPQELGADIPHFEGVLGLLVEARLVVSDLVDPNLPTGQQDGRLELAHESLIRRWKTLQGWLAEERKRRQ